MAFSNIVDVDRTLETMDQEMRRLRNAMMQNFNNASLQFVNQANRPGSFAEHRSMLNPVETDAEGNRCLKLSFDVHNFKPEEVEVSLDTKKRCLTVEAKHESKNENGDDQMSVKRHYVRSFYLPESVIDDVSKLELKSTMAQGALSIEAPLPKIQTARLEDKSKNNQLTIQQQQQQQQPREIQVKRI